MPDLTPAEDALLRTHPHKIKEYLAVLHPATVLACQLDGAHSGDPVTAITYKAVTEGAFGDVVVDMTLWVGSAASGRDKGTCRIRKAATANTLYVAEDSAIDWADNDHLTVVLNWELWVKYPRIIADGSCTFYKDWEITYSDQQENWPPVAILGPPDCQFIDPATGLATAKFVGEHSYPVAPGATISAAPGAGYAWTFPSGTPPNANTPGTDVAPHSVTWDTPGIYWVTLTVTDSNGKTHTGRRPIFIFSMTGADVPYSRFKMAGRSGDLNQHGHTASFEIHGDADQAEFPDRALVVYFTEDYYGSTKQSIGGNFEYREHIKFAGYIQRESTVKDPQTSVVTFDAATIHALMDSREGFSCWIKNTGNAANWCQATNLTADRAALSLCRYHSTLLDICDVIISGDTEYIKSQEFAVKTSLLQQLQSLYDDLFAHVACDKHGRVYFEVDPQMRLVADRAAIDTIIALAHGDWRESLDLPRPQENRTSFINLGGVHYGGHGHAVQPILSKAPGDAPGYTGKTTEISGLILAGQTDGNEKAGLALARDNNQFPDITLPMPGLWDVFDIVPQEYVTLSLLVDDTKRGIVWTAQKLIPRHVGLTIQQTEHGRIAQVDIRVEKDSFGPAGVDGDYPDDVPDPSWDLTPYPTPIPSPPGGEEADGSLLYFIDYTNGEVYRTRNARAGNPALVIYEPLYFPGVTPRYIALDSWDPQNVAMVVGADGVWKTTNLNDPIPSWTQLLDWSSANDGATMVASSICQEGLWMVTRQTRSGIDDWVRVYWTTTGGASWSTKTVTTIANTAKHGARIETSSHDAQKAWATWMTGTGAPQIAVTTDQWATFTMFALGTTGWKWPANPHHRFFENAADAIGFYAGGAVTRLCTTAPVTDCTNGAIGGDAEWIGSYTWGTNRYWALAINGTCRIYVSDDAIAWTLQETFAGIVRFISGWPYLGERFYATQDGLVAPLLISDDRADNWQEQTGNWAAVKGPLAPTIYCCVPVWIE